jgi:DNA-binding MarR family transcriptional regulator
MDKSKFLPPQDEVFVTSVRLPIMLILYAHKRINFTELETLLHLTSGNLNFHLKKLLEVDYVKIRKSILTGRIKTIVEITKKGEIAFKEYIGHFKQAIDQL